MLIHIQFTPVFPLVFPASGTTAITAITAITATMAAITPAATIEPYVNALIRNPQCVVLSPYPLNLPNALFPSSVALKLMYQPTMAIVV